MHFRRHADRVRQPHEERKAGSYKAVEDALMRLSGCRIKTNIRTGEKYV